MLNKLSIKGVSYDDIDRHAFQQKKGKPVIQNKKFSAVGAEVKEAVVLEGDNSTSQAIGLYQDDESLRRLLGCFINTHFKNSRVSKVDFKKQVDVTDSGLNFLTNSEGKNLKDLAKVLVALDAVIVIKTESTCMQFVSRDFIDTIKTIHQDDNV